MTRFLCTTGKTKFPDGAKTVREIKNRQENTDQISLTVNRQGITVRASSTGKMVIA